MQGDLGWIGRVASGRKGGRRHLRQGMRGCVRGRGSILLWLVLSAAFVVGAGDKTG